jgi:ACR3 family arsenite efflux pump ArsB
LQLPSLFLLSFRSAAEESAIAIAIAVAVAAAVAVAVVVAVLVVIPEGDLLLSLSLLRPSSSNPQRTAKLDKPTPPTKV